MAYSRLWLVAGTLCLACGGSDFKSGADGGAGGVAAGAGMSASGGTSSSAGSGATANGGANTAGAANGGAGAGPSAGAGGSSAGSTSTGGSSTGGGSAGTSSAGAGGSAGADCTTLKAEYAAAVEKARACDSGSTDECDKSSTMPAIGCGCATLVNAKSDYTTIAKQKYQAIQDAKCGTGLICNMACLAYTSAACSAEASTASAAYECTGTQGVTAQ
jgi:hypothetical protein